MTPQLRRSAPLLILALLAVCAGCEIADPALPTFSTKLAVPVGTHDLTVAELIEDEDFLYAGADSVLHFSVEGDTTDIELDLDFSAEIEGLDTDVEIGPIVLDDFGPVSYGFALAEIWPEVELLPEGTWPVPAFTFEVESGAEGIEGFESADVSSGRLVLALENGLPIPVSGSADPERLVAEVFDSATGTTLVSLLFDVEIPAGGRAEAEADLAGVELPASLGVRLSGGSVGAAGVSLDPEDALGLELSLSDLVVDAASAEIGAQSFEQTGTVALPDSLYVVEATVESGAIDVTLSSGLPVPATVYLYFNEFRTPEGGPYILSFEMPRNGVETTVADLAGATITAGEGAPLDSLSYTVGVVSPGSGGEIVTVHSGTHISANLASTTLSLGEITGIIPERSFALEPMTETLDLPDELDGVLLAASTLTVDLFNGTGITGTANLNLVASSASGATAELAVVAEIEAARAEGLVRTTLSLDEDNSNIADLLSLPPESLTLTGSVTVGGDDVIGTISPDDICRIAWHADAPLRLSLENSEIDREPEPLDLDEDLREQLDDHLVAAELLVEIDNRFPFGVDILFLVGPDSLSTLATPDLVIGPLAVAAGEVGETSRYVEAGVVSTHVIELDAAEVRAFTREGAYTALRALIPGTDGEEVLLRTVDGLSARGALSAEIIVEDDE